MNKEKPGCHFCPSQGHTWSTPEGKRICFDCLRAQRDRFKASAERALAGMAALLEEIRREVCDEL